MSALLPYLGRRSARCPQDEYLVAGERAAAEQQALLLGYLAVHFVGVP